jgi:uncharacterized protein (TIGR01244 family)
MQQSMKINDDVTVGGQPDDGQLAELARGGFKAVVNLRTAGEQDQPLSPEAEGERVRALGMEYAHLPVSTKDMRPEQVDEFRERLAALPKPAFVHCHRGKRAGAFVMMGVAVEQGMSGDQTLQQAEQMGFQCDQPELKEFVKGYVDRDRK